VHPNSRQVLFVTRKYPPAVGGMEKMHFELSKSLEKVRSTKIIAYGGSQKFLPVILPILFFRTILFIFKYKSADIILGDALLSIFIPILKLFGKNKIMVIAHGLDITYNRFFYQQIVIPNLKRANIVVSISNATKKELIKRGISETQVNVIPVGINISNYQKEINLKLVKNELAKKINLNLSNKKLLLTVGRLVERKGHAWFINQVMPLLDDDFIYLIIGEGEQRKNIEELIAHKKLQKRVFLLGKVNENYKIELLRLADVFIMPNIEVKNDPEGFGIVALEAAAAGLPIIATKLEGIKDSIANNLSGYLIKYINADIFVKKIIKAIKNKKLKNSSIKYAYQFSWDLIINNYLKVLV